MLSPRAKSDLDGLRAEGLKPTDEDIIRLNALALRITNGPETTAACAPRWAEVGGIVLWEPSLAAWEWFDFARTAVGGDENVLLAFACSRSRIRRAFETLFDSGEARRAVRRFRRETDATAAELARAVAYVTVGYDDAWPDKTPIALKREAEREAQGRKQSAFAAVYELMSDAAATTGLTFDDIMLQTPSRLASMIYAYHVQRGEPLSETSAKAQAGYLCTLHNIRERLKHEAGH